MKQCLADTPRKIAALRSNEALMVRRYKAVEDSEMNSRKECIKLREEVVNIENAVTEKIGELVLKFYNTREMLSIILLPIVSDNSYV